MSQASPADDSIDISAFDEGPKMDKVVLKNSIAYHYTRQVRLIEHELFVTRQISLVPMLNGMSTLKNTLADIQKYCNDMASAAIKETNYQEKSKNEVKWQYLSEAGALSYPEASAKCKALGLQLPEIHSPNEMISFSNFLKENKINNCFAGVIFDPFQSIFRFETTGIPVWHGFPSKISDEKGNIRDTMALMDDAEITFFYHKDGQIFFQGNPRGPVMDKKVYERNYRDYDSGANREIQFISSPVVCQNRWDGRRNFQPTTSANSPAGLKINVVRPNRDSLAKRDLGSFDIMQRDDTQPSPLKVTMTAQRTGRTTTSYPPHVPYSPFGSSKTLIDLCLSVSQQMNETISRSEERLIRVLSLADISVKDPSTDRF